MAFLLSEEGDSGNSGAGGKAGPGQGLQAVGPPSRSSISSPVSELQFSQDSTAQSSAFSFLRYLKAGLVQRVD